MKRNKEVTEYKEELRQMIENIEDTDTIKYLRTFIKTFFEGVGIKMMNKLTATALFDKNSCLIGNKDVIPKSEAIRLLGSGAVEFADRADSRYQNAYGIGDFAMEYLTREGFFIAVTYKNVEEQKQATKVKETNK